MNFSNQEKIFIELTKKNIEYFNQFSKAKLAVEYYVDNGNVVRITKDGKTVMDLLTIEAAYYAVAAIIRFQEV